MSKKIVLVATLLVLVFVITGLSCKKSSTSTSTDSSQTTSTAATTTVTDLTTVLPATVDSAFTTNYNSAKEKALLWKGDAKLVLVSLKLPRSLEVGNATESFTFGSDSDKSYWWNISIAEKTSKYVRAIIPKEDYLGTAANPINSAYWKTNYLEAFQIAEKNGGQTFRKNNTDVDITLTLSQSEPKGWLWWVVEYKSTTGSSFKLRLNPNDKTVVDELGNTISNGASTTSTSGTTSTGSTTSGTTGTTGTTSTTPSTTTTGTSTTSGQ